jgi:hypothetical protein
MGRDSQSNAEERGTTPRKKVSQDLPRYTSGRGGSSGNELAIDTNLKLLHYPPDGWG